MTSSSDHVHAKDRNSFLSIVWPKNFKMYPNIQSSGCFNLKEYLCFFKNVTNVDRNTANALHNSKGILTLCAA